MAASEKITTKNKKVRFSNTPHESSGYFLRELKNEGLSVKEIEEIFIKKKIINLEEIMNKSKKVFFTRIYSEKVLW